MDIQMQKIRCECKEKQDDRYFPYWSDQLFFLLSIIFIPLFVVNLWKDIKRYFGNKPKVERCQSCNKFVEYIYFSMPKSEYLYFFGRYIVALMFVFIALRVIGIV